MAQKNLHKRYANLTNAVLALYTHHDLHKHLHTTVTVGVDEYEEEKLQEGQRESVRGH